MSVKKITYIIYAFFVENNWAVNNVWFSLLQWAQSRMHCHDWTVTLIKIHLKCYVTSGNKITRASGGD